MTACFRREIKRLIINIPPRYTKSLLCTVMFPTWVWIHDPSQRFLCASYSNDLSTKHSVDRRDLLQSDWYRRGWCDRFSLAGDQNVKTEYKNNHKGVMVATSMKGTATGKGGNFIIIDDPHDVEKAQSDVMRQADIDAFDRKFTTRLDDKENGVIVVIMQRMHENDLTGHLLEKGGYEHLCLPMEAHERTVVHFPITKQTKVREKGELLHPERESQKAVDQKKIEMGSYGYAGQYQQDPAPREGGIFKRAYWQYYRELPSGTYDWIQSWDTAFKDLETSDYVVGQVWCRKGSNKYLVDQFRAKAGIKKTERAIKLFRIKYPKARKVLIEDSANGPAVKERLQNKVSGVVLVKASKSKEERAMVAEPQLQANNVHLPDPTLHPWVEQFVEECAKFPKGKNDDQVDACTQGLIYLGAKEHDSLRRLVANA